MYEIMKFAFWFCAGVVFNAWGMNINRIDKHYQPVTLSNILLKLDIFLLIIPSYYEIRITTPHELSKNASQLHSDLSRGSSSKMCEDWGTDKISCEGRTEWD